MVTFFKIALVEYFDYRYYSIITLIVSKALVLIKKIAIFI